MHVRAGLDMLTLRGVPANDPYSYLSDQPWINHTWLFDLLVGALYRAGGAPALSWTRLACALLLGGLVWRSVRLEGARTLPSTLLALSTMVACSPGLRTVRPQLFSYLLFAGLLLTLRAGRGLRLVERLSERSWTDGPFAFRVDIPLVLVVPILCLWANVHGSVLLGSVVLLTWFAVRTFVRANRAGVFWNLAIVVAALAATFVTPYGLHLWAFLLENLGPRTDLTEWQPLRLWSPLGLAAAAATIVGTLVLWRHRRHLDPALVAAGAVAIPLPWLAERHVPYLALSLAIVAGPLLVRARMDSVDAMGDGRRRLGQLAAAVGVGLIVVTIPATRAIPVGGDRYPIGAVEWLETKSPVGRLTVPFDWGGFVAWHLGPAVRVSMDSRRENVYTPRLRDAHDRFEEAAAGWQAVLVPPPEWVLVRTGSPLMSAIQGVAGWKPVYADRVSTVFSRADVASPGVRTEGVEVRRAIFP